MTPEQDARLRFRQWLIDHDLEPAVAYAILETMPPFDWSEIARRDEMLLRFRDVDKRFEAVDKRFDEVDKRFDEVDKRFDDVSAKIDGLAAGVYAQIEGLTANIDGLRSNVEGQLLAMEGRLSLRWMETTRIIVFAMVTLFLGFVGVTVGLLA